MAGGDISDESIVPTLCACSWVLSPKRTQRSGIHKDPLPNAPPFSARSSTTILVV